MATIYKIAPENCHDFDLAGEGNEFDSFDAARDAAYSLQDTMPIDDWRGDWTVYRSNGSGGWERCC